MTKNISQDTIRTRIRNLLKKAEDVGATEAEKTGSFLMAQKMMLKHGITEEDALESDITEEQRLYKRQQDVYEKPITDYVTLKFWEKTLAMILAPNFKCFTYTNAWNGKKRLVFLGMKDDTEIAADVFEFAGKAIVFHSGQYIENREGLDRSEIAGTRNDYISGYLDGLKAKFAEQVKVNNFQLALIKDELVVQKHEKLNLKAGKRMNVTSMSDKGARSQGFEDGKQFNYGAKRIGRG